MASAVSACDFGARLSGHPLGERFAGGDGRRAAAREEAGFMTRPFSKRAERRIMSPQAGLVTSTLTAGGGSSPACCGILKIVRADAGCAFVFQLSLNG